MCDSSPIMCAIFSPIMCDSYAPLSSIGDAGNFSYQYNPFERKKDQIIRTSVLCRFVKPLAYKLGVSNLDV